MNRRYVMTRRRSVSIRDAAFVMEQAYLKASQWPPAGARPADHVRSTAYIQQHAEDFGQRFDQYFTQQLLPEYIETYGVVWNVVYDARGNFTEPHTKAKVPLGTLQVRGYLTQIRQHKVKDPEFDVWEEFYPTLGPEHRFGAILFRKRASCPCSRPCSSPSGMTSRSCRPRACRSRRPGAGRPAVRDHAVPLLVLHDFDKAGFSIAGTLQRSTRRYRFGHGHAANVIDLGLRLEDVDGLRNRRRVRRIAKQGALESARERRHAGGDRFPRAARRAERLRVRRSEWIEGKLRTTASPRWCRAATPR